MIDSVSEAVAEKDVYLANFAEFEKSLRDCSDSWLHRMRSAAIERFAESGFPTIDEEDWRFTNLAPIARQAFQFETEEVHCTAGDLARFVLPEDEHARLVFVNGRFREELSSVRALPAGVEARNLAEALDADADAVAPYLGNTARYLDQPLTALNTAFVRDGAFLSISQGVKVEKPIHLLFVSAQPGSRTRPNGKPWISFPRTFVVAGAGSRATIVESHVGLTEGCYFANAVSEIVINANAEIDHYRVQQESRRAYHISTTAIQQDRDSRFSTHGFTFGAAIGRNDVNATLEAEGCECTLNGLYLASGGQLLDNHTRIDHAKPRCASHELYKGILDGDARGVFNGKILVRKDAQKTDAKQTNKTLLLSRDAMIDSKPQLEIFADDVKCTHGATIGQLSEEALFYLRSRGIGHDQARALLVFAFANDVVTRVKLESLREKLERQLLSSAGLAEVQRTAESRR